MSTPIRRRGRWRKRWVYVGAFADEVMACAARVEVGPFRQTFWAILDRSSGELAERTKARVPGARGEVRGDATGMDIRAGEASGSLRVGAGTAIAVTCPTSEGNEVWTRKRAGVPIVCELAVGERRWRLPALADTPDTGAYHPPHPVWSWPAGGGEMADGVPVAWNLVEGVNDPPRGSERAIWLGGEPSEPGPVSFDDLDAIDFADGSRLTFEAEAERARQDSLLGARYSYRQPFGTFAGTLPGGGGLARGMGVMEHHDAIW